MDNHDFHRTLDLIEYARENQEECLLPHTTYILQLFISINGPLKAKVSFTPTQLGQIILSHTIDEIFFPQRELKKHLRKPG